MTRRFLDTNVIVYAFSTTDGKTDAAGRLLADGGVFSVQVANELVDVGRRKLKWSWSEAADALGAVRALLGPPVPLTDEVHREALDMSRRLGFRIYESLLISAASLSRCRELLTEDLQDGQVVDGVVIRNPFLQHA